MRSVVAVGWLLCLSLAASQLHAASPRRWIESLPSASEVIDGYMSDGAEERIAIAASNPIEDVWKLVATGGE